MRFIFPIVSLVCLFAIGCGDSTQDLPADNGATNNGATNNGATNNGATNNGANNGANNGDTTVSSGSREEGCSSPASVPQVPLWALLGIAALVVRRRSDTP